MTPKQEQFVREYLIDLNATQAAIRAGYSKPTAEVTGSKLLRNAKVAAEVAKAKGERAEKTQVTAQMVLDELKLIAFARTGDYIRISPDGDPYIDLSTCTPDQLAAISEVTCEDFVDRRGEDARTVRKVKVKFHDKKGALVDFMRHLGMFTDKVDHTTGGQPFKALIGVDIDLI